MLLGVERGNSPTHLVNYTQRILMNYNLLINDNYHRVYSCYVYTLQPKPIEPTAEFTCYFPSWIRTFYVFNKTHKNVCFFI